MGYCLLDDCSFSDWFNGIVSETNPHIQHIENAFDLILIIITGIHKEQGYINIDFLWSSQIFMMKVIGPSGVCALPLGVAAE